MYPNPAELMARVGALQGAARVGILTRMKRFENKLHSLEHSLVEAGAAAAAGAALGLLQLNSVDPYLDLKAPGFKPCLEPKSM
jgi:hypothetical protein